VRRVPVRRRPLGAAAGLAIVAALVLAACGAGPQVDPAVLAPPTTAPTTTVAAANRATPGCTEGSTGTVVESSAPAPALPTPGDMPAGSFMAAIAARGRLVAGTSPDQLLFGYVNPLDGRVEGLDADLLREVAIAIFGGDPRNPETGDAHTQFVTLTLDQRVPDVAGGQVDIVADTMTITCQRRLDVDFSAEYYDAGQRVLVPKDSTVASIQALGGKQVCTGTGTTSYTNIQAVSTHPIAVGLPDQTDCLVALQQGQVDAISTDDTVLAGLAAQDPYTKVVGPRFTDEPYGLAISLKHPELTQFVNGVLASLRSSGELESLYVKWLGPAFNGAVPAIPTPRYRP